MDDKEPLQPGTFSPALFSWLALFAAIDIGVVIVLGFVLGWW